MYSIRHTHLYIYKNKKLKSFKATIITTLKRNYTEQLSCTTLRSIYIKQIKVANLMSNFIEQLYGATFMHNSKQLL